MRIDFKTFEVLEIDPYVVCEALRVAVMPDPQDPNGIDYVYGIKKYLAVLLAYKAYFDDDGEYYRSFRFAFSGDQIISYKGLTLESNYCREKVATLVLPDDEFVQYKKDFKIKTTGIVLSLEEALTHPLRFVREHACRLKNEGGF